MNTLSPNKTVGLQSVGCKTNQQEIAALATLLAAHGFTIIDCGDHPDIIILNTCSVTATTESKTLRLIWSIARHNPHARVMVIGCLAQQLQEQLFSIPTVWWVVGTMCKDQIPAILNDQNKGLYCTPFTNTSLNVSLSLVPLAKPSDPTTQKRTRYTIKIQEGCDYQCSYCIVPILRGPSRCMKKTDVLKQIDAALLAGFKEIVVSGTHIGQYRDAAGYTLLELLNDIIQRDADFRVRISSLDPRDCTDQLMDLIVSSKRICQHVHLSMQSVDEHILSLMNRQEQTVEKLFHILSRLRNKNPWVSVGGDFIVGFPQETAGMFEHSLSLITQAKFSYGHVFRYSQRPGTVAALMKDQVAESEKTKRAELLRSLLSDLRQEFVCAQINSIDHTIIVESDTQPANGLTSNYIRVEIPGLSLPHGEWCSVRLTDFQRSRNRCSGRVL